MKTRKPLSKWIVYTFFIIGLVAAAAFRALIVLKYLAPEWFRPVWYVAVVGYIAFFLYRYGIAEKRRHAVVESGLVEKIKQRRALNEEDRAMELYLLQSLMISRENWNYLAIFVLSLAAIAADLVLAAYTGGASLAGHL